MVVSYTAGGKFFLLKIFQLKGSVFPRALFIAVPCSLISCGLKVLIDHDVLAGFQHEESILKETQAFAGFSFLVGFLIVFRTSQGYNRFWDGCAATHQMRAEWFDAAAALVAFCKHSKAESVEVLRFKNMLIRLFSMLHASALAELEEINLDEDDDSKGKGLQSFDFDLIDPGSIDLDSLRALKFSTSKVELIFSWIQFLIVENMSTGVLSIPPPILSRSFQEIANGMVAFHNAMKITYVPFPFPYAQTCDLLLLVHWILVPLVTTQWVSEPVWAFIFVLMQVFILWSLNLIAVEIENPFGQDPNDLNGRHMQAEMNRHLLLLLQPETLKTPFLVGVGEDSCHAAAEEIEVKSFNDVWVDIADVGGQAQAGTARMAVFRNADVKRRSKKEPSRRSVNTHRLSFTALPAKPRLRDPNQGMFGEATSESVASSMVVSEMGEAMSRPSRAPEANLDQGSCRPGRAPHEEASGLPSNNEAARVGSVGSANGHSSQEEEASRGSLERKRPSASISSYDWKDVREI